MSIPGRSVNSNSLRRRIGKFSSFCLAAQPFQIPWVPLAYGAVGMPPEIQPAGGDNLRGARLSLMA